MDIRWNRGQSNKNSAIFWVSTAWKQGKPGQPQEFVGVGQVHLNMRTNLLVLIALFAMGKCHTQGLPDHVFLVRHAEKAEGKNPPLSEAGRMRAGELYRTLRKVGLQQIYVSQYLRTQQTADSLRIYLGIDTIHYVADDTGDGLLDALKRRGGTAKTILVVGHSNTIPMLVKRFRVRNPLEASSLPDEQYDLLFHVNRSRRTAILRTRSYGAKSSQSNPKTYRMQRD